MAESNRSSGSGAGTAALALAALGIAGLVAVTRNPIPEGHVVVIKNPLVARYAGGTVWALPGFDSWVALPRAGSVAPFGVLATTLDEGRVTLTVQPHWKITDAQRAGHIAHATDGGLDDAVMNAVTSAIEATTGDVLADLVLDDRYQLGDLWHTSADIDLHLVGLEITKLDVTGLAVQPPTRPS